MNKLYSALVLFWASVLAHAEDLKPPTVVPPIPSQESAARDDLFSLVDQQARTEVDWKSWPLDPSKGNHASLETMALIIKYPYREINIEVFVYQLPDGAAGLPWVTYVWVDRGKKYQTSGLSPTPLMVCAEYTAHRWTSLNSISESEWKEIDRIAEYVTELPLQVKERKVQTRRLRITRRVHPLPEKLLTQGGAATVHELEWASGTPLAIVESGRVDKVDP